jgi:uncharacterized membrane protein YwzB
MGIGSSLAAASAFLAVFAPIMHTVALPPAAPAFLAVLVPVVVLIPNRATAIAFAASPLVLIGTSQSTAAAFLAILGPVVVLIPNRATATAFAASPLVLIGTSQSTAAAFLAILGPVVTLVTSFSALQAFAAFPFVKTEFACDVHFLFVLAKIRCLHTNYLPNRAKILRRPGNCRSCSRRGCQNVRSTPASVNPILRIDESHPWRRII